MSGRAIPAAMWRYFRRLGLFMTLYVPVLLAVAWTYRHGPWPAAPWSYLAAVAPALPILGAIWAIFALIAEEADEYQRFLHMKAQLLALALTLGVCTVWNFLSNYSDLLPDRVWVFPVYCACLFPALAWTRWRAR